MVVSNNNSSNSNKKIHCIVCNKKCTGNVLRYQDHYYHKQCFELDHRNDLVYSSSSSTTHQQASSKLPNKSNTKQTLSATSDDHQNYHQQFYNAEDSHQNYQAQQNNRSQHYQQDMTSTTLSKQQTIQKQHQMSLTQTSCAGCGNKIKDGQALVALDLHWHIWCFKCSQCQTPLHGEYVAKDGKAYCEKDYQKLFGVICVYCKRYITGKVLQAGEAHHFHPSCARCSKCGDPFVPGEEMYLQGEVTWHPRCGPGPADHPSSTGVPPDGEYMNDASSRSQVSCLIMNTHLYIACCITFIETR